MQTRVSMQRSFHATSLNHDRRRKEERTVGCFDEGNPELTGTPEHRKRMHHAPQPPGSTIRLLRTFDLIGEHEGETTKDPWVANLQRLIHSASPLKRPL